MLQEAVQKRFFLCFAGRRRSFKLLAESVKPDRESVDPKHERTEPNPESVEPDARKRGAWHHLGLRFNVLELGFAVLEPGSEDLGWNPCNLARFWVWASWFWGWVRAGRNAPRPVSLGFSILGLGSTFLGPNLEDLPRTAEAQPLMWVPPAH